jgi:hypothetical protein
MTAGISVVGIESLVVTVTHRVGKGRLDKRDEYRASALPGRVGVSRCGGPLARRPHLQRGFHGDRGEQEHPAATTVTR